jgi:hypothetical protein
VYYYRDKGNSCNYFICSVVNKYRKFVRTYVTSSESPQEEEYDDEYFQEPTFSEMKARLEDLKGSLELLDQEGVGREVWTGISTSDYLAS